MRQASRPTSCAMKPLPCRWTLGALDAFVSGQPAKPTLPKRLSLIDYRFLELVKAINPLDAAERAEPALLVGLAQSDRVEPRLRIAAAELAARDNILDAAALAAPTRAVVRACRAG